MIDAHQHCWRVGRHGFEWPTPDLEPIHRDFGPADWRDEALAHGVCGSVLVQSQPCDADTDYLLQLAGSEPRILAVVGWADLEHPQAVDRLAQLAQAPKLRGIRPMLQNLADDQWILRPALAPALDAMQRLGLRFDALVFPRHLATLKTFSERHPELPIVLDHGGKPGIANGEWQPWADAIEDLARLPNLWCKLSGLLTEAGPRASFEIIQPYVAHLLESFGPQRTMWGSDWPVLNLAGRFASWLDLTKRCCEDLSAADSAELFGGSARRFYGL